METGERILACLADLDAEISIAILKKAVVQLAGDASLTDEAIDDALLALQRLNKITVQHEAGEAPRVKLGIIRPSEATWPIVREQDLEQHVERYLWRNFDRQFGHTGHANHSLLVCNTARGGITDGVWKRPDLTAAVVSRFEFAPTPTLDLLGFELKLHNACNVPSVHEALSHTAHVHFAYLVVYIPPDRVEATSSRVLPQVLGQAQMHGIGVITMSDPRADESYTIHLEAQRKHPPLHRVDEFIQNRFHNTYKLALKNWLRNDRDAQWR